LICEEISVDKIIDKFYSGAVGDIKWGRDKAGRQRYAKSQATIRGSVGMVKIAERLTQSREIYSEVEKATDFREAEVLKREADKLDIHKNIVLEKISERKGFLIGDMEGKAEELFNEGKLEELVEVRDEARKYKWEFPGEFTKIDSQVRGLRLQLTGMRQEEEREKARIEVLRRRREDIEKDFERIEDLYDIDKVRNRIRNLEEKDIDVSDLESQLEGIEKSLEEEREAKREETRRRQEEVRKEKEEERAKGIEPEF